MIIVARNIEGCSLNGLEYLLDEDGEIMEFESKGKAEGFLRAKGFTDEDMYYMRFIDNEKAG